MAEIEHILTRFSKICGEINLNYVIVGGLAAILRSKPRTTMDIDIILEDNPKKIKKFLELLKVNDFDVMENQTKLAFESGENASIFDNLSTMRLDIKIAQKAIDQNALKSSQLEEYFGLKLKVASVNFILLGKIWFLGDISDLREDEYLEYNDIKDFINVYLENLSNIDFDWLKEQVDTLQLQNTLSLLLDFIARNFDA